MKMTGNTILITGGGSGIGRRLAESFHALGNQVIIAGRREQPLREVCAGNNAMSFLAFDQNDSGSILQLARLLAESNVKVLINNAGVQRVETLLGGDLPDAESTLNTNLLGPMRLTAALLPLLLLQESATILNVSSTLAFVPAAMIPTYCASKAALHSYTQSLRFQLRHTSVQVIELIPPWVQTELQGERGKNPKAMPLDEYIAETMQILTASPQEDEILVERAKVWRSAERGDYASFYQAFNNGFAAAQDTKLIDDKRTSECPLDGLY